MGTPVRQNPGKRDCGGVVALSPPERWLVSLESGDGQTQLYLQIQRPQLARVQPRGGRPRVYADTAIECALVLKAVFHLSLRATWGFLDSVVRLMGVKLPVPDYTRVSRCQGGLEPGPAPAPASEPRHVVVDATEFCPS
jgi:hypothetical protein